MVEETLLDYWFILYKRKWIVIIITVMAILTAVVLSKRLTPIYEAKAVFFVPQSPDVTTFFTPPGAASARTLLSPNTNEVTQGPYIGILKSRTIAELVHKDFPNKSVHDLMRKDTAYVISNEFMLQIYARDKDPVQAAGIANAYVKYFNAIMSGYSQDNQMQKKDTISSQLRIHRNSLMEARKALKSFQEENNTADIKEETKQLILLKTAFESQMESSRIALTEVMKKIAATEAEIQTEMSLLQASEVTVTSALLVNLKEQLLDIESKIAELKVEFKEAHPTVKSLMKKYEMVQNNVGKEIERIIKSQIKAPDSFFEILRRQLINFYIDKERITASIKAGKATIAHIDERIEKMPALEARYDSLSEKVDKYKKLIETLDMNLQEVEAQSKRSMEVVVWVERATPPTSPSFPLLMVNAFVALFVGLSGSIFYCFFLEYLDNTREKRMYRLLKAMRASEDSDG